MIVYRVANLKHKDSTLSGIGAEKVGGRWNEIGIRAVYYYVHSENIGTLPEKIVVAKIEIPKGFIIEELAELPERWNQYPYSSETTEIFSNRAIDKAFFGIKVPSTIVPLEFNFVLNPLFRKFGEIEILEFLDLPIDERLKTDKH